MKGATVRDQIEIKGPNLFGVNKKTIIINPSEESRIILKKHSCDNGVEVNISHLYGGKTNKTKARYAAITDQGLENMSVNQKLKILNGNNSYRVIEHLFAALNLARITSAEIIFKTGFIDRKPSVPSLESGIEQLYHMLKINRKETSQEILPYCAVKSETKEFKFKGIPGIIKVEPSDKLEIIIESSKQPDLPKLNPEPIHILDAYEDMKEKVNARPIGRLRNALIYRSWEISTRILSYKGISDESYILAKPGNSVNQIISKMNEEYQEGRNEHLYHTALDFFGELFVLSPNIRAKFTLANTNHLVRIPALKYFQEKGVFQIS